MTDTTKTDWDAIVIGLGMGGMAAAAALSKVGHKVLLLEQYVGASVYAAVWRCSKRRFSMVLALISFRRLGIVSALPR